MAFTVQDYDSKGNPVGGERRIGICEECWGNIEKYGSVR
jgi:hypothetical protein